MHTTRRDFTRRQFLAAGGAVAAGACLAGHALGGPKGGAPSFRAGAAAVDITPGPDVRLDGPIMRIGPVREIHDPLHVRALVLDDGQERLAIAVVDATVVSGEIFDRAKQLVHKRTGLATDRMLTSATHTHMAPRSIALGLGEGNDRYEAALPAKIAEAVCTAVDRLSPAKVGWGAVEVPRFVHNRRWIMKPGTVGPNPFGETGEQAVMGGRPAENRVKNAGPVDPELSILSVQHADGRPLALVGNYGIHYVAFKRGAVSADYFGYFAERTKELLGPGDRQPPFVGMMTNGTSGDVGSPGGGLKGIKNVGYALAEEAARLVRTIEHRGDAPLAARQSKLELGVRRPSPERIAWARAVQAGTWNKPAHGRSKVYAHNALRLAEFPPTLSVPLQALRIGELGIAASPCEVFAETGLALKEQSPFEQTFHIELANGYSGYLPPPAQFELGGYTTWPAESSCLEVGAEPKIRAELLRLLRAVQVVKERE